MDFLKKISSEHQTGHNTVATEAGSQNTTTDQAGKPQGGAGGILNSLNDMMGGGAKGEQKEGKHKSLPTTFPRYLHKHIMIFQMASIRL